jgi:hypothetical protein
MARPLLRGDWRSTFNPEIKVMRHSIIIVSLIVGVASRAFGQAATAPLAPAGAAPSPTEVAGTPPNGEVPTVTASPAPSQGTPAVLAQPAPSGRGATVWGILPWGGIGVGARYMIPIGIPSLLSHTRIRDNFSLEFGADLLRWSYGEDTSFTSSYTWTEVLPVVGVSWNLWFSDSFALYPKLEAGYAFGWLSDASVAIGGYGGTFVSGAAGLLYKLGSGLTFRAEAGSSGLKAGVGWLF